MVLRWRRQISIVHRPRKLDCQRITSRSPLTSSYLFFFMRRFDNGSRELKSASMTNFQHGNSMGGSTQQQDGATANRQATPLEDMSVYHIKWIHFHNKQVPIVTQNENGPCPLIAIANVLLLRQAIKLPANTELVTSQQIVEYFGDYLLSADMKNLTTEQMANFQQNMNDAFTLFPKLQTGLDMNLRFKGARDFEYTPELGIFDLFEIPIYHGWLVDPQETDLAHTVRNCSYNQLVEKIINDKMSEEQEVVRRALLAEQFLEQTASQLTYYGLCELNSAIKEDQLAVFFRNNHFNTLYMHNNTLYLLVTDQGFLQESQVVWETLNDVEGNSHFTDSHFRVYQKPEVSAELPAVNPSFVNTPEQVNSDYQLALSLANDNAGEELPGPAQGQLGRQLTQEESDYALARRLQEEEDSNMVAELNRAAPEVEVDSTATDVAATPGPPTHPHPANAHNAHRGPQGAAAAVRRSVPRSASHPSHAGSVAGPAPGPQRRPVSQQAPRRRESGDSCLIL